MIFVLLLILLEAYDEVRRDLLIQQLAELGIHVWSYVSPMSQASNEMYRSVPLLPKQGDPYGPSVDSTCGVN